eukprot:1867708-Prymnesium_polylepis.1
MPASTRLVCPPVRTACRTVAAHCWFGVAGTLHTTRVPSACLVPSARNTHTCAVHVACLARRDAAHGAHDARRGPADFSPSWHRAC